MRTHGVGDGACLRLGRWRCNVARALLIFEVGCSGARGCQPPGQCFSGGLCARAHGLCGGDGLRLHARVCSLLWRQGDLFAAAAGPSPARLLASARPALLSTWRQCRSCALAPALSVAMDGVLACEVATTASGPMRVLVLFPIPFYLNILCMLHRHLLWSMDLEEVTIR